MAKDPDEDDVGNVSQSWRKSQIKGLLYNSANPLRSTLVTKHLDQKTEEKHHEKGTSASLVRGKDDAKRGDCCQ